MTRIVFMGTSEFAAPILKALAGQYEIAAVYTRADKPAGRGRRIAETPVKAKAIQLSVPIEQPRTLRSEQAVLRLTEFRPDLVVVAAYGLILPQAILNVPVHGSINTHASLLPRWRGASPIASAILAGDKETGVTLMQMDAGVDTGPVLARRRWEIAQEDTTSTLSEKLSEVATELLLQTLPEWLEGKITPVPQLGEATFAGMVRKEDGLIDWNKAAFEIERSVRAFNPWPSAYTYWRPAQGHGGPEAERVMLKIWGVGVDHSELRGSPGTVLDLAGKIGVATRNGLLVLREVQLAGKRAMPVEEFVRGHTGFVGAILGR